MISGFVGTPGSGKTYEAVKKIVDNIQLGRKIYTNIDGMQDENKRAAIQAVCNVTDFQLQVCLNFLTDEQARAFWLHCEPGSLIIIDEVHKLFSNREWNTEKNQRFCDWASTHRHEGYDVLLITQDIEKIDKHARSLIEWTYYFRKVNFLSSAVQSKYICYTYQGDDHNGKPLQTSTRTYDKKIFACYSSYVSDAVTEKSFMKSVNIFKHPVFFAIPVVFGLFIYFGTSGGLLTGQIFEVGQKLAEAKGEKIDGGEKLQVQKENVPIQPAANIPAAKKDSKNPNVSNGSSTVAVIPEIPPERAPIQVYKDQSGKLFYTNMPAPVGCRFIKTI